MLEDHIRCGRDRVERPCESCGHSHRECVSATLDGKPILISQPAAGTIVAFTAICTHQGCTVAPAGKEFQCPCHGSVYNAATGAVITGPAPAPLAGIPVKVEAGNVVAG